MVAGQGVSGRQEVDIDILEDVWGFETIRTGNITGEIDTSQITVFVQDDGDARVTIGGSNVGGAFVFEFKEGFYKDVNFGKINTKLEDSHISVNSGAVDSKAEGAAVNFALFLEQMLDADAFNFIEDAGASTAPLDDIDVVLSEVNSSNENQLAKSARYRPDNDDIIFSGAEVSGRTDTDDTFETLKEAENFVDTLQIANSENGFLDEILV